MSSAPDISNQDHNDTNLFNTIMPETQGNIICIQIDKPISEKGYAQNFLNRIDTILEKYPDFSFLIYYKEFQGWETQAASLDMASTIKYGKRVKKVAVVNPPKRAILQNTVKQPFIQGEIKFFLEHDLDEALEWIKS